MSDLGTIASDVGPRVAGTVLRVRNDGTFYDPVPGVEVDLSGAVGVMPVAYDASAGTGVLLPLTSLNLSVNYTNVGKLLMGDGSDLVDFDGKVIYLGSGAPGPSVGHDGGYYLDTATGIEYGPRGATTPGTWDATGRKALLFDATNSQHLCEYPINLGGTDAGNDFIYANEETDGTPIPLFKVTNYAALAADGAIGFELQIAQESTGFNRIRPYAPAVTNADLQIDGKGTGRLKDWSGNAYLKNSDLATRPCISSSARVVNGSLAETANCTAAGSPYQLAAGTGGVALGGMTNALHANGLEIPAGEGGNYDLEAWITAYSQGNSGNPAQILMVVYINGVSSAIRPNAAMAHVPIGTVSGPSQSVGGSWKNIALNAGDRIRINFQVSGDDVTVWQNFGTFCLRRVS